MAEMKYYYLVKGDYIQSGDEYLNKKENAWMPVKADYFGKKFGYDVEGKGEPAKWAKVRRLVPVTFEIRKQDYVPIAEQYGEEFEI